MSTGLNITIYDDNGQLQLVNNLRFNSGVIETPDMLKGTSKKGEFGAEEDEEKIDLNNLDINQAPGMALSSDVIEAVSGYLEATVLSLIANGAANVMNNIGINQENLQMAKLLLNIMDSAILSIDSIIKFVPKNIHMVPSAKVAMSTICTSLKDMFDAMYISLENQYYLTINEAITNLPSTLEILKDSQELLLTLAYNMIDEQCVKYTGYTLVELYYMCNDIISTFKAWKAYRKSLKHAKESGYVDADFSPDIDGDAIKQLLLTELLGLSDTLYNAFMIIQVKEAIDEIKSLIRQFNNIDLTVLADGIDSLGDLIDLLDEIGLNDNSNVLTLADAVKNGINMAQNQFNGLTQLLMALGIQAGMNIASTAVNSVSVNFQLGEQAFSFSNDLDKHEITLNILKDPTIKKVRKNITDALSKAETQDGKKIFDGGDVLSIIELINVGYNSKKDLLREFSNGILFKIHFELEGFNKKTSDEVDIYETVNLTLKQAEDLQKIDKQNADENYELGVITEEFTDDPTRVKRRPTIALVHELYAILQEVFPLMKIFAELVSNYKINKAKVENNAKGNLSGLIKALAKFNKLTKKVNTHNKNFYTIRNLLLYNYVSEHIKRPTSSSPELQLTLKETNTLYLYLKSMSLNYTCIDTKLETVLFIDKESIDNQKKLMDDALKKNNKYFGDDADLFTEYPESKYEDGTTIGIDKIEVNDDEVYYSDSSLPMYGSLILRCFARDYDVSI